MISSTNFSNKFVIVLAVVLIGVSACSTTKVPALSVTKVSADRTALLPIAVLPIDNLSGTPAPLNDLRQLLIDDIIKTGLNLLDIPVLDRFMANHRMRYVGGIDSDLGAALNEETGAGTVLITSLELYSEVLPPKIALTSRLVSADAFTSILWTESIGLAGDDSPGILGLGLIENPQTLFKTAANRFASSLAGYMAGQNHPKDFFKKPEKFRPRVIYRSPVLDPDAHYRVAVLPFLNLSERKFAGEIIALHFVRRLGAYDHLEVIEPGVARQALLGARIIMDDGLSLSNADVVFSRLDADLVLTGKIMDYQDYQGPSGKPKVDFSALLIERKSREVVWSSKSSNEGDEGVYFFDMGKVNTAHEMAAEMVQQVVALMLQP